jgi:hypothetical protein
MSARPQSVNDETPVAPRLRKDQRTKIQRLIEAESTPEAALIQVSSYVKGIELTSAFFNEESNPTSINVTCKDPESKMGTQYQFKLRQPVRIDPPTL